MTFLFRQYVNKVIWKFRRVAVPSIFQIILHSLQGKLY